MKTIKHIISKDKIEEIWAEDGEYLDFANKFKYTVHLGFKKGEEKLSRWEKVQLEPFLKAIQLEGKLKKVVLINNEVIIELF